MTDPKKPTETRAPDEGRVVLPVDPARRTEIDKQRVPMSAKPYRLLAMVKQDAVVRVQKEPDDTVMTWPHLLSIEFLAATVMSNLGLHLAMRAAGVDIVTTGVGDRYVLEALRAGEYSLGGEQSGHLVMPAMGTTGDGIVTGIRLMSRIAQTHTPLATLAASMHSLPQVLINVEVDDKATVANAPSVRTAVAEAEAELGDTGRILLRDRAGRAGDGRSGRRGHRPAAGDPGRRTGQRPTLKSGGTRRVSPTS